MVRQLHTLFENYDFMHYLIAFVKDKNNNLMLWGQDYVTLLIVSFRCYCYYSIKSSNLATFIEKFSHALVIGELSLFKRLSIVLARCVDPLGWWWIHEIHSQILVSLPN